MSDTGFKPELPSSSVDTIYAGTSDRSRIEQAYALVSSQLPAEERAEYDSEVLHFIVSGDYASFMEASERNRRYMPRGEKPIARRDRRRKRGQMAVESDFIRCSGCGSVILDNHDGQGLECECGLEIRRDDSVGYEIGYNERGNYEYRTNSIYKRPNHLHEVLMQLQGVEKGAVDDADIDRIKEEARKYRIDLNTITMAQVRTILERLRLPKLYEHSANIVHTLSGRPPIVIPEHVEMRIKAMFNEVCIPVYPF